jgi:hypothetical protein
VALSYRLIECTLSTLLMLEPICLTAAVNRLLMLGLLSLTAPPPHSAHSCFWYFWRYSCARSGIYNSALRLMQHITSHIRDNYR